MAVYVDKARHPYRGMIMCHMLADTLDELHAMADQIGIDRRHFQILSTPHYDVCQAKRRLAVQAGAVEIERREVAALIKRWRSAILTDPTVRDALRASLVSR